MKNWVEKLKDANYNSFGVRFNETTPGFNIYPRKWDIYDNYFGVSLYHPDIILQKDDKEIIISLQGVMSRYNHDEKLRPLWDTRSIKYIQFSKNNNVLFETWSGETPPDEIINEFV